MLKRELLRMAILGGVGILISIFLLLNGNQMGNVSPIISPFYLIGMFYGIKVLIKLLGKIVKTYFSFQFMSLLINPLIGTILSLLLLFLGIFCLFSLGWIVGLIKCICSVYEAHQMDKQCIETNSEYDW